MDGWVVLECWIVVSLSESKKSTDTYSQKIICIPIGSNVEVFKGGKGSEWAGGGRMFVWFGEVGVWRSLLF